MQDKFFTTTIKCDWEGFLRCIKRDGEPDRIYFIELFIDPEIKQAICERFELMDGIKPNDEWYEQKREIAVQRFLGYDFVRCGLENIEFQLRWDHSEDTSLFKRSEGRRFVNEHSGPITNWGEYEAYPWPDVNAATSRALEWYEKNLPDDMCVIASGGFAHFAEFLNWLMGYETLCYALFDNRNLVKAISDRLVDFYRVMADKFLQFERVKILWGSDDMGFRSGTLISPDDLREFVLPGHKMLAKISHNADRPYLLHSCGKLESVMDDLIEDVGIDAIHSFEDTIIDVIAAKQRYGDKTALLGGIDVDFLCRADERQIRSRVKHTLDNCQPGGGFCLGTGNSVTNYIPLDNYLIMLDEGRKYK